MEDALIFAEIGAGRFRAARLCSLFRPNVCPHLPAGDAFIILQFRFRKEKNVLCGVRDDASIFSLDETTTAHGSTNV